MKLYHLSFDLEAPLTRMFRPRVPESKAFGENWTIPRICFSRSVIGCINALPEENLYADPDWNGEDYRTKAVLYSIDSKDISPGSFIDSHELYEKGLVPDALVNQECWCLEPVQMTGEIVDIRMLTDCFHATLYCAKENEREFVYSVIDRVCDNYARDHTDMLDQFSLFYIMNSFWDYMEVWSASKSDLEREFFRLSRFWGSGEIDAHDVFSQVQIDGKVHCVDDMISSDQYRKNLGSIDEMIGIAEGHLMEKKSLSSLRDSLEIER